MTATYGPGEITGHCQVALAAMERALPFLVLDEGTGGRFLEQVWGLKTIRSPQDHLQRLRHLREICTLLVGLLADRTPSPDVVALLPDLKAAETLFGEMIALLLRPEID